HSDLVRARSVAVRGPVRRARQPAVRRGLPVPWLCAPCTQISTGPDERAGRWLGTSKCGGECGIHTRALKPDHQLNYQI
ncbi:MAG: hypothetical protein COY42_13955, partial [Armatimonadetes bacterium CG_4_10_14_0_8_um_filter_66_14]